MPKMSSDIDEEEDYSSIDERDPKIEFGGGVANRQQQHQQQRGQQQANPNGLLQGQDGVTSAAPASDAGAPAYVNLNDAKLSLDLNGEGSLRAGARRDKNRPLHNRYGRKSRSRERPRGVNEGGGGNNGFSSLPSPASTGGHPNSNLSSPINPGPLNFVGTADPDRIRERERELEKIHRRSRELMLSPRMMESRSRDSSSDRLSRVTQRSEPTPGSASATTPSSSVIYNNSGMAHPHQHDHHRQHHQLASSLPSPSSSSAVSHMEGWKPAPPPPTAVQHQQSAPPPLPPRIHSPPGSSHRYKSPSPAMGSMPAPSSHHHHQQHHFAHQSRLHQHHGNQPPPSLRRRVQSPNRRDFKDFSQQPRDFKSPMRFPRGSYFDDDDDSGADSLGNELGGNNGNTSSSSCGHAHCGGGAVHHHQHPRGNRGLSGSTALVPYEPCCSPTRHLHHHCLDCGGGGSTALQVMPGVEERLLQLEGDKDSLHMQVAMLSDQIEGQTDKICDLERVLDGKKDVLRRTEENLQREMLSRSSLETRKLELLSEISGLKLRQATLEKENGELRNRLRSVVEGGAVAARSNNAQLQQQRKSYNGGEFGRGVRGATVVDTVMTLPPSGRNYPASNSSSFVGSPASTSSNQSSSQTTLQTFGTLPRRSGAGKRGNGGRGIQAATPSTSPAVSSPPPLETHFDQNCDDDFAGSWFGRKISNAQSGSAPSLAANEEVFGGDGGRGATMAAPLPRAARHQSVERVVVTQYTLPGGSNRNQTQQQQQQQPIATKPKGLRKFLGRMRRSNSGTIHEDKKDSNGSVGGIAGQSQAGVNGSGGGGSDSNAHLKRGGFRASAGSRFAAWMGPNSAHLTQQQREQTSGGNHHASSADPSLPFRQWRVETICSWLDHLGLYMYSGEVRRHIKIGEHLLALSSHDLESKLGMKSTLHRKKVLLALQVKQDPAAHANDLPGRLDHQWVVRWLDDVGLPQYKDAFLEARVDGRVLNFLTVEDLFQLKVTNLLHHLSIRRGVQVLRQNEFEPSCLRRRATSPEERDRSSSPPEVALWTNHRVMEWLRHVDLAEYAPNLRGSGVHGGLLVHEPRFTPDLLASLLSIPAGKTLLRRHLSLHFRDLVGAEAMQEKRAAEDEPNHQALTPTARVKPQKRPQGAGGANSGGGSQFSLRRRKFRADELDFEDMVCPLNEGAPVAQKQEEKTN